MTDALASVFLLLFCPAVLYHSAIPFLVILPRRFGVLFRRSCHSERSEGIPYNKFNKIPSVASLPLNDNKKRCSSLYNFSDYL